MLTLVADMMSDIDLVVNVSCFILGCIVLFFLCRCVSDFVDAYIDAEEDDDYEE